MHPDGRATVPLGRPRPGRMLWVTAAWGGCFVAIRWGLRDAPVLWFAALRGLVAGVALVALATAQGRPRPAGARSWWLVGLLALTNTSIAFAAMFAGVDGLATGTAAVLSNAQPLLVLLPAWWLYGERVTARTSVGLVVGFAGLLVVAVPGGGGSRAWLSILAATAITAGTLVSRRLGGIDLIQAAGWHFLIGGAVLAGVAAAVEGLPRIDWTMRFTLSLLFLGLIGSGADYDRYVDGRPRFEGTRSFLASRGITLPVGAPGDPPGTATLHGLGNRKNELVLRLLTTEGVEVFDGSVRYAREVRAAGLRTAVVSSSANTAEVLTAAGIADLFDARIDGVVARERGLAGKPAPDTFLAGAAAVGVAPGEAAVFEDALAGVAAGRAGGFGLVVGVDRVGHADALRADGADVVVGDLDELLEDR